MGKSLVYHERERKREKERERIYIHIHIPIYVYICITYLLPHDLRTLRVIDLL